MRYSFNINIRVLEIFTQHKDDKQITFFNIPVLRKDTIQSLNDDMMTIGKETFTKYFGMVGFQNSYYWPQGKTYMTTQKGLYLFHRSIYSFSSLNDGSKGSRFYFLGLKGIKRTRLVKSKGLKISNGKCTRILDMFKTTVYFEKRSNKRTVRKLTNTFA